MSSLEESFIVLTVLTEATRSLNAERRITDSRSREKSLHELEFNDLNIHLYLTLNYGTASEHLDFDFMVLYNAFVLSRGLTIAQNSIHTILDLDRVSPIPDPWKMTGLEPIPILSIGSMHP